MKRKWKYKMGDKVLLNPESAWNDGFPGNPVNTPGTIVRRVRNDSTYDIKWADGSKNNSYEDDDLLPATKLHMMLAGLDTEDNAVYNKAEGNL